ncbi:MAG: methylmalonyl Co-A mutase-associated GTPase MeaB [Armatimonadota bacterium]|nr:methylmalonyl Co-A mutase-associated GTPase MeaB [Armatimonadota bacterium]
MAGSSQAAARLISLAENHEPSAAEILQMVFPFAGRAYVVGITGPPGSGKSTLVNALIKALRGQGQRVAVVAVDPTSPFTGGALLGDRIRMQDHSTDPEVFVRSMATRGSLGGLAPATDEAVAVLGAWGAATILIETVGTGQAEVDIVSAADTVVVVTAPGFGDGVQTIKAGVMEIGDVFVVNKADRPEADRAVTDLRTALGLAPNGRWKPPVLTTVATNGEGVASLLKAVWDHRAHQEATGALLHRRRDRWRRDIVRAAEARLRAQVLEAAVAVGLEPLVSEVARGALDPHTAAARLLAAGHAGRAATSPPTARSALAPVPGLLAAAVVPDAVPDAPSTAEVTRAAPVAARTSPGIALDHIGIAVRNLDSAGRFYREVLGLTVSDPELLLGDAVAVAFVDLGGTRIELLEAATVDGPVARFIERRGEGIHHIALAVPDAARALENARDAGYTPIDELPRAGAHGTRVAFLHPKDTHGVLIELVDRRGDG